MSKKSHNYILQNKNEVQKLNIINSSSHSNLLSLLKIKHEINFGRYKLCYVVLIIYR